MSDKKVLFLCSSLKQEDGWSQYAYDVITRVHQQTDVVVFCHEATENLDQIPQKPILKQPIRYIFNPVHVIMDCWKVRRELHSYRDQDKQNFVHCTNEGYQMFFPFLFGLNLKLIMTIHGTYSVLPLTLWKSSWLWKLSYYTANRIVSGSYYTKQYLQEFMYNAPTNKIKVLTNGVNYKKYSKASSPPNEQFRILCVGSVKHRKGAHHLVRVARILKQEFRKEFTIYFVGRFREHTDYAQKLTDYVKEHDLQDNIKFTGMVSEESLESHYSNADLFVLLSVHENYRFEGYPLVFHEAAARGLPTIGSFNCGAQDAIDNGISGLLVNPHLHQNVALKIKKVMNGEINIEQEECQKWAEKNAWDKKNLMSLYEFNGTEKSNGVSQG